MGQQAYRTGEEWFRQRELLTEIKRHRIVQRESLAGVCMPKAPVNGIELHYETEGEGPAVVFCHGVGGNHMSWWQQVPEFARDFRAVVFDQRGFAESRLPPEAPGAEAFADDLAGLLDHLGIDEAYLVGQSMGGRTVLNFARRHPHRVKAMVMAATMANIRTPELDQMRREVRERLPKDRLLFSMSARVWEERPDLGFLYKLIRSRNPDRPKNFLFRDNVPGTTAEDLASVTAPVLFIVGEEDQIAPPPCVETASRLFPNARLVRVPEAGHSVYFEQPQVFNRVVREFFDESR
ncbi:MAG: alpha/beta hydrolase [Chloroflexi bacterium]|nr:alpha/beta hydrolase [Chloroflexota bacterium]